MLHILTPDPETPVVILTVSSVVVDTQAVLIGRNWLLHTCLIIFIQPGLFHLWVGDGQAEVFGKFLAAIVDVVEQVVDGGRLRRYRHIQVVAISRLLVFREAHGSSRPVVGRRLNPTAPDPGANLANIIAWQLSKMHTEMPRRNLRRLVGWRHLRYHCRSSRRAGACLGGGWLGGAVGWLGAVNWLGAVRWAGSVR